MEPDNEKVEEEEEIEAHMDEIKEEEKVANIKKVPTAKKKKKKMGLRGINADDKPYTKAEQDEWNAILAEHRVAVLKDHPDWNDNKLNEPPVN